jgi:hypothetical protein
MLHALTALLLLETLAIPTLFVCFADLNSTTAAAAATAIASTGHQDQSCGGM